MYHVVSVIGEWCPPIPWLNHQEEGDPLGLGNDLGNATLQGMNHVDAFAKTWFRELLTLIEGGRELIANDDHFGFMAHKFSN